MKPNTEELLYHLLWTADLLLHPTLRNMTDSFEGWAYRNGFHQQLNRLANARFVEKVRVSKTQRLYRLTEQGRLYSLGGRDPAVCWERNWDGNWRIALFDVPNPEVKHRNAFRKLLLANHYGCLQKSVWISPDPIHAEILSSGGEELDLKSLFLMQGRPCGGESDPQIVAAAWDFEEINRLYQEHIAILKTHPRGEIEDQNAAEKLRKWGSLEREAWNAAMSADPLLPKRLIPKGYLGFEAWRLRTEVLVRAGEQIRKFRV